MRLLLVICAGAALATSSPPARDLEAARLSSEEQPMPDAQRLDSLRGRTVRWTFSEGPMPGASYEHTFHEDGTVVWRVLDGPAKGKSARENAYAAVKVGDDVFAVSYLAASGYTLTVVLNVADRQVWGFASNEKEWYPLKGTCEVVP